MMMSPVLKAAAVQFNHVPGKKEYNLEVIASFVARAAEAGVELLVFPEMCITGYWHVRKLAREAVEALAEPVPNGPSTQRLLDLARQYRMTIGAGLIERGPDGRLFNSYVAAMPDGTCACHRKLHLFISEHLSAGDSFTTFMLPQGWRAGILICYDNNIVENARMMGLAGVDVLLAPHQTGGCRSRSPRAMGAVDRALWDAREESPGAIEEEFFGPKGRAWLKRWLPSRAHDNGMYLVFSNGVGPDDDEVRTGNAMIIDCYGEIMAETWRAADEMVTAELRAEELENCTGRRWLKARRPELYSRIAEKTGKEEDTRKVRLG